MNARQEPGKHGTTIQGILLRGVNHFLSSVYPDYPMGPMGPMGPMPDRAGAGGGRGAPNREEKQASGMKEPKRVRSEFPETWLWSDTVMG